MSCPPGVCGASGARHRPRFEVGDIARHHGARLVDERPLSGQQRKVLRALSRCRTAELGGHIDVCESCAAERPSYNSCRDRHCPKCQALAQHRWLEARLERIVPTHHFHVVFTLPPELRHLVLRNRVALFDLLFDAAPRTLLELGRDPRWLGARLGLTAVLHTWSRALDWHPHLHCVVTGGGLGPDDRWRAAPRHFLFPVRVIGALFRGKYLAGLRSLYDEAALDLGGRCSPLSEPDAFDLLLDRLYRKPWVVYAKPPFGGTQAVYAYLGRYTHRIAISNARLVDVDDRAVVFRTRDRKTTSLPPTRFLSRFLLHVLPPRFVRIRHLGLLAPGNVHGALEVARRCLGTPHPTAEPPPTPSPTDDDEPDFVRRYRLLTGIDVRRCPRCRRRAMVRRALPGPTAPGGRQRAPPEVR